MLSLFRKKQEPSLKLFFATDIHGSDRCFRKFLNAAKYYGANVLLLGGDVTGKALIPLVKQTGDWYQAKFLGREHQLRTASEAAQFEQMVADAGLYTYRTDPEEAAALAGDTAAQEAILERRMAERLTDWVALAEERLRPQGIRLYLSGGNDDPDTIMAALPQSEWMVNSEAGSPAIGGAYTLVSCGYSNPTPWDCPRDVSEAVLAEKLATAVSAVADPSRAIFNFHVPPVDSQLDTCPQLDTSAWPPSPVTRNGETVMFGAGSSAVRGAIEQFQPVLALHGHIHESRNAVHIGRTLCINPGSEYTEGILRGALVTLSPKGVENYHLTSG